MFGLLRNVEGRSNGQAGNAFLGQVAAGEGEGDEGFVGRANWEGVDYLIQVSFEAKAKCGKDIGR